MWWQSLGSDLLRCLLMGKKNAQLITRSQWGTHRYVMWIVCLSLTSTTPLSPQFSAAADSLLWHQSRPACRNRWFTTRSFSFNWLRSLSLHINLIYKYLVKRERVTQSIRPVGHHLIIYLNVIQTQWASFLQLLESKTTWIFAELAWTRNCHDVGVQFYCFSFILCLFFWSAFH